MLRTKLDGGATVAFGLLNGDEKHPPQMQIEITDRGPNTYLMVEMTLEQAEDVAANLNAQLDILNDMVCKRSTKRTQEETNDRKDTAALDIPLQLGDERHETESLDRGGTDGTSDHRAVEPSDQTDGETDMRGAQFGPDADEHILNLHPRAEQLLRSANQPVPAVDLPSFINVEIDDEWMAHIGAVDSRRDEVSAALSQDRDEADRWQYELDLFVDGLELSANKRPNDRKNIYFDVIEDSSKVDLNERRLIRMPITVQSHPWLRSKAMRNTIVEVFAQAFRYGAQWEVSRAED